MTKQYTTRESIVSLLQNSHTAVERAVVAIYRGQTEDEQSSLQTTHDNGIGYNGADAEIMSSFAQQILGIGSYEYNGQVYTRKVGKHLSEKQLAIASKKIVKYAGQLLSLAQAKETPAVEECPDFPVVVTVMVSEGGELFDEVEGSVVLSGAGEVGQWVNKSDTEVRAYMDSREIHPQASQATTEEVDADWEAMAQVHVNSRPGRTERAFTLGDADNLPYMSPTKSKFFLARMAQDMKVS